jgi:hypothetical protein
MATVQMGSNLEERASRPGPWAAGYTPRTDGLGRRLALSIALQGLALGLTPGLNPVRADVVFQNCLPVAGGGITCDTRPEGNTLMNDEAARYGLLDQASPGWDEFEPYQGYDDMFGGNET